MRKAQESNPRGVHSQDLGIDSLEEKLRGVHSQTLRNCHMLSKDL
jgi:hypothetical protein